jgi:hypothetical protein
VFFGKVVVRDKIVPLSSRSVDSGSSNPMTIAPTGQFKCAFAAA